MYPIRGAAVKANRTVDDTTRPSSPTATHGACTASVLCVLEKASSHIRGRLVGILRLRASRPCRQRPPKARRTGTFAYAHGWPRSGGSRRL